MDHIPPPPYSETDPGTAILTPGTSQADNESLPAPSAVSSTDSVVYTPPYTPTEAGHQSLGTDLDHVSSSSATAYFESRPAHMRSSPIPKIYTITITSTTKPEDIPFPSPAEEWKSKDVTEQDWVTFLNYLFPDHAASVNSEVFDRKLKAELIDERMHRLTLGTEDRSRTNLSQVEAQLEPLRQTPQAAEQLTERLNKIDAMITEWNNGFFEPRGYQLRFLEPEIRIEDETRTMPGAWIPSDHEILEETQAGELKASRRSFRFGGIEAGPQGFRMGALRAGQEGFRWGNMIVADSNGFRVGGPKGFIADGNGVKIGGRVFGRRDDRERGFEHGFGGRRGHHGPHHRGRGRHAHGHHGRRRGRSQSTSSTFSSSSSSSSSSSDSDLSVGSLPEYNDLKDQQLPIARQSLVDWLNHPEQPITRETVRNIKEEIKVAKKSNPRQFDQDVKALRGEVRGLMKEFKEAQKAQKTLRKQVRKEKRIARRTAKKERRAARREERRQRKGKYKADSHAPGGSVPAVPGIAAVHSMPAIPQMPLAPGARGGFPFGGRGPFGKGPPFGRSATGPPGITAMHGGWAFARGLSTPGCQMAEHMGMGGPISSRASNLHQQMQHMMDEANRKETKAIDLRAAATGRKVSEKEKLKKIDEAVKLEEEAERFRREADRLKAEAAHLDGELARGMEEEDGQATGVIEH